MPGPIALVGSGEYLPVMAPIDRYLIGTGPARVVMLPTAAGQEGAERVRYWTELGLGHFRSLGIDAVVLNVLDHDDAHRAEFAEAIEGAGLIYLSGGSPAYLTETLRYTPVMEAIIEEWERGAALAGCSAGACALSAISGGFRNPERLGEPGLGLIEHVAVIPHFDHFDRRSPRLAGQVLANLGDKIVLIGIDERTALIGISEAGDGTVEFVVMGEQAVWWIDRTGERHRYKAGTRLSINPGEDPKII